MINLFSFYTFSIESSTLKLLLHHYLIIIPKKKMIKRHSTYLFNILDQEHLLADSGSLFFVGNSMASTHVERCIVKLILKNIRWSNCTVDRTLLYPLTRASLICDGLLPLWWSSIADVPAVDTFLFVFRSRKACDTPEELRSEIKSWSRSRYVLNQKTRKNIYYIKRKRLDAKYLKKIQIFKASSVYNSNGSHSMTDRT